jgi:hypothetical protein
MRRRPCSHCCRFLNFGKGKMRSSRRRKERMKKYDRILNDRIKDAE